MAILVVDDSRDECLLVGTYLKSAGYTVVPAHSAKEALHYLKELTEGQPLAPIDMILLDIKMPGVDGLDACVQIKSMKQCEAIPIFMISADATPGTIQLAYRRGATDYIRKPIIKAEVLSKVAMMLRLQEDAHQRVGSQKTTPQKPYHQNSTTIDVLTGILNWWSFDEIFEEKWKRVTHEHLPISLIFCALENFKAFNDKYGYATGDECLQKIAQCAQETFTQPGQIVGRYRGAEFVVLLVDTGAEDAKSATKHLHKTIEALDLGLTVVLGVATAHPDEGTSRATLLTSAKNALPNQKQ